MNYWTRKCHILVLLHLTSTPCKSKSIIVLKPYRCTTSRRCIPIWLSISNMYFFHLFSIIIHLNIDTIETTCLIFLFILRDSTMTTEGFSYGFGFQAPTPASDDVLKIYIQGFHNNDRLKLVLQRVYGIAENDIILKVKKCDNFLKNTFLMRHFKPTAN